MVVVKDRTLVVVPREVYLTRLLPRLTRAWTMALTSCYRGDLDPNSRHRFLEARVSLEQSPNQLLTSSLPEEVVVVKDCTSLAFQTRILNTLSFLELEELTVDLENTSGSLPRLSI